MTLEQAIAFAAQVHAGQEDKAGAPYILHPLRVMARMKTLSARRVAVLHDVMEDCGVTADLLLRLGLPRREVEAIEALSKRKNEHGYKGYFRFIERAAKNPLARKVKVADLEDNSDTSRLKKLKSEDRARLDKYRRALAMLRPSFRT